MGPMPVQTNSPNETPATYSMPPKTEQISSSPLTPPDASPNNPMPTRAIPADGVPRLAESLRTMAPQDREARLREYEKAGYDVTPLRQALGGG